MLIKSYYTSFLVSSRI